MLPLLTLFSSVLLVNSLQQGTYVPSAHLEGGVPRAVDYAVNHVITAWNRGHPKSHVMDGFEYAQGRLQVPASGRYYVYAQIYFNKRPQNNYNRVAVYANNRLLLMIHKDMSPGQENTGFTGGVFELNAGEKIYVKVLGYNTKMWLGPNHSFFGAYLI
ncbi:lymphotoxin-alpha-like [Oculina patagonica]